MPISSRTPEGDPNRCPICGLDTRTEPSETPTRDAPCPHCGHLLWFELPDEEPPTLPERSSKSYEGTLLKLGRQRFGAIPVRLVYPLLEALGALVGSHRIRAVADLEFFVDSTDDWIDLTLRLRRAGSLPSRFMWRDAARNFIRRRFWRRASQKARLTQSCV
jgi:hypothetical protein